VTHDSIRVGLVDDHPAIFVALAAAIGATDDLAIAGTGRTVAEALDLARRVEVLVCDVQLDGHAEGIGLLAAVHKQPDPPAVLLVSGFRHRLTLRAAMTTAKAWPNTP
jgi:DNA-binding NarL/FixJ family response regulator